jgi:exosortase
MKLENISQNGLSLLHQSMRTAHNRILICGVLVGLCYLPVWLLALGQKALSGSDSVILNLGFLAFGLRVLWQKRHQLAQCTVTEEEQFVGHLLILGGAVVFFVCRDSLSLQSLIWAVVLIGIAYSCWGYHFFKAFALPSLLVLLSMYTDFGFISYKIWETLTPPYWLENFMAWVGGWVLKVIGQSAVVEGRFISLPTGAVEVGTGCNGFSMAFTIAGASLILGLFMRQSRLTILAWVTAGVGLALLFNVPRIVLLTFASVYWGEAAFNFWHGPIGGQIFSCLLFTAYYYIIMGMVNQRPSTPVR